MALSEFANGAEIDGLMVGMSSVACSTMAGLYSDPETLAGLAEPFAFYPIGGAQPLFWATFEEPQPVVVSFRAPSFVAIGQGRTKTIRIKITNGGSDAIEGVPLTVTAPGALSLVSATISPKYVPTRSGRQGRGHAWGPRRHDAGAQPSSLTRPPPYTPTHARTHVRRDPAGAAIGPWTWPVNLATKGTKGAKTRTYILKVRAADCATPSAVMLGMAVGTTMGPNINVRCVCGGEMALDRGYRLMSLHARVALC